MENDEFRVKLRAISVHEGVEWGRAALLANAEQDFEESVEETLGGFLDLTNATNCFFLETVERINTECRPHVKIPLSEFYPLFMSRLVLNFNSLCGAQRLALNGYPLLSYTCGFKLEVQQPVVAWCSVLGPRRIPHAGF